MKIQYLSSKRRQNIIINLFIGLYLFYLFSSIKYPSTTCTLNIKHNIITLSRLPSAFSKYAFISFKQIFEWLMNISQASQTQR